MPYLNEYDATATDMADMFTDKPDFTPYNVLPVDPRIFDPEKALSPLDEHFNWEAVKKSPVMDNVEDMVKDSKEKKEYRTEDQKKAEGKSKGGKLEINVRAQNIAPKK